MELVAIVNALSQKFWKTELWHIRQLKKNGTKVIHRKDDMILINTDKTPLELGKYFKRAIIYYLKDSEQNNILEN